VGQRPLEEMCAPHPPEATNVTHPSMPAPLGVETVFEEGLKAYALQTGFRTRSLIQGIFTAMARHSFFIEIADDGGGGEVVDSVT